jgi:2-polyprenyl-3-methyl-5-hydroxy-6-metoxy-1,4-benzoquinol methylase
MGTNCNDAINNMVIVSKRIEKIIQLNKPNLLDLFRIYSNEAIQARQRLNSEISNLNRGDSILEIGAGILALSLQLSCEGFKVTSVEPVQQGFQGIEYIIDQYLLFGKTEGIEIDFYKTKIESYNSNKKFDYIFAVNVFEHVESPQSILIDTCKKLRSNGKMRIICPNYGFPYEPHFGRFLFRRKNGAFFGSCKQLTKGSPNLAESVHLFNSLNFISYTKISKHLSENNLDFKVNKDAILELGARSLNDELLAVRHKSMFRIAKLLFSLRIQYLVKFMPNRYSPIIDLTVIKNN